MADLDPRTHRMLEAIVVAYAVEEDGQREPLMHLRLGAGNEFFKHRGWPTDGPAVSRNDIEDLVELKLVRVEDTGTSWRVAPTAQAVTLVERHERDAATGGQSVSLSWQHVSPVLEALVQRWEDGGAGLLFVTLPELADELGPHVDHIFVQRAVDALEEDGFVECHYEMGTPHALASRPLPKALGLTRGWPTSEGTESADRLTAVLEQLIAEEPDDGKRRKLAMVRDLLIDLGARTASEFAARLIGA